MKKLLFVILTFMSFSFINIDWWNDLLTKLEKFNLHHPYEKVYLHTDQTYYQPGDVVWFVAYLINQKNQVSDISSVLYVDVIQPDGKVAKTLELSVQKGKAAGTIKLGNESTGGIYKLKAYTQWMKNFEEVYYFSKEITVYRYVPPQLLLKLDFDKENYGPGNKVATDFTAKNLDDLPIANQEFTYKISIEGIQVFEKRASTNQQGKAILTYHLPDSLNTTDALLNVIISDQGISESISRGIPIVLNKITVEFFPEGGDLIEGTSNRIAFKTTNEYGKPADINGAIYDQEDNLITSVNTFHMGMGIFSLKAENKKKYYLKITQPAVDQHYPLPQKYSEYGLSADYVEEKDLVVLKYFTTENYSVSLAAISAGQKQYFQNFTTAAGWNEIEIDVEKWPIGITRFTLFDQHGTPQAERLLFLNKRKQLEVTIATDKESYYRREKVKLKISTKDETGKPVSANLSLAVANDQLISLADDKQANILSSLLLDSELRGELKEPDFYFDSTEQKADAALDLVMLTHGWRRFSWEEINAEDYLVKYLPEQYSTISGTIYNARNYQPLKAKVYLVETGGKERVAHIKTGKDGRFMFMKAETTSPLQLYCKTPFYSTNNIYIDLDGDYGTSGLSGTISSFIMQPDIQSLYMDGFNVFSNEIPSSPRQSADDIVGEESRSNVSSPMSMSLTEDINQLSEIVVVGYGESGYTNVTAKIVQVQDQQILGGNFNDALQGKAAGVQVKETSHQNINNLIQIRGINSLASNNPLIVVDGMVMNSFDLQQIVPDNIKSISIVKGAEATNLYGMQAINGVIIITTDKNIERNHGGRLSPSNYAFLLLNGRIYHRAREFSVPDYDKQPITSKKDDFRNTIYWNPEIITDENGVAEVSFFNSDASTTFRITTEGIGGGLIGRAEKSYAVNDAMDVQVKIPPFITIADSLLVAVNLKNNMHSAFYGTITYENNNYFEDRYRKLQSVNLEPEKFTTQYLTLKPAKSGDTKVQFEINEGIVKQHVENPVKILPIGFPVEQSWSSNQLQDTFAIILNESVPGSIDLSFVAYPNLISDLLDGLESIIREPYGCFEQVSASTFPNIMVLQYMQENRIDNPEIKSKALRYIANGYEKLIAYETSKGGYEWFGHLPPHEGLTAFGLLQFLAMKKVWDGVDSQIIDKTAQWLLERKNGTGGFIQSQGKYAFSRASELVVNAYIIYALTQAGYLNVEKEFETAINQLNGHEDNYRKALLTLAAFNLGKDEMAEKSLKQIAQSIEKHGISKLPADHSITYSMGKSLEVETASFCALAMMRSSSPDITAIKNLIDFIVGQRSFGGFGSTQATILSLQALVEFAKLANKHKDSGDIVLYINGKMALQKMYGDGNAGAIVMKQLGKYLKEGTNELLVKVSSEKSKPLPYSLNLAYNSFTPLSSPDCMVDLVTGLSNEKSKLQETVRLTAKLTNKHDNPLPMTLAIIGIPAGLSLQPWQLKEMQEKQIFDYYEIRDNYLVIYLASLPEGVQQFNFDLKADFAGSFQAPASVAYLYYSKEDKDWEPGEIIEIDVE